MAIYTTAVLLLSLFLSLFSFTYASNLIHLPLSRKPVPLSRLFSVRHRPWARHLSPPPVSDPPVQLHNLDGNLPQAPLFGGLGIIGEYYLTLTFAGQPINLQVDTGSSTIAVPLKECINCRPHDHRLDLSLDPINSKLVSCDSPSCAPNVCNSFSMCSACSSRTNACCSPQAPHACGFFLSYADQSGVSGALVHTNVAIAGITVPLTVAAVLAETKGFENTQVDGILGMAYSPLACNPTCIMPLFDTLVNARVVKRDVFSICTASNGGTLTLGGSNPNFYHGKLAYVPLASRFHLFYDISLTGVEIGGRTVDIPYFNHAIVDSGTTVMVVTNRAFKALKHHFQSNYCNVPGLCVHQPSSLTQQQSTSNVLPRHLVSGHTTLSNSSTRVSASWFDPYFCANLEDRHIAMLPDIVIKLENNVRIVLEPDVYMIKYEKADTFGFRKIVYRCLGISSFQGMDLVPNNVILGNTVLQKYFVEYDRENSRLGFAVAKNCVDPNVKAAESSTFLGRLGSDTMRQWMARIFTVAAILAWVVVVFLCTRKTADDGERYTPIPATY